jgi:hypothetical protein
MLCGAMTDARELGRSMAAGQVALAATPLSRFNASHVSAKNP